MFMVKFVNKIVFNVVFGFDIYVVMRYGVKLEDGSEDILGCYFCNDVVVVVDVSFLVVFIFYMIYKINE